MARNMSELQVSTCVCFVHEQHETNSSSPFPSDLNECAMENNCHQKADCINSEGSYQCLCQTGFTGNGSICIGQSYLDFYADNVYCYLLGFYIL